MFWRGVWGYLPANIVQGITGFLAIVVFTRLLSPEDFGRYALAFSIMTLSHVAVFSWLEASMARFWAAQTEQQAVAVHFATLYRSAFLLSAIFVPVVLLVLWLAPWDAPFKLAVAVGLLGSPAKCLGKLAQERYRAAGEVAKAAGLDMYIALAGFGIGALFAWAGGGGASPLAGLAIAPLFALPFILPGEIRQARRASHDPVRVKEYAAYGYPIAASLALTLVLSSTDRFLLAWFMDEAAVGVYHAGYSIANRTLDVLFIWLGAAGTPALVMALERGGRERLVEAAKEQSAAFILIALPAAAGVALVARPLAEFMIGEDLRQAAASVTPVIAVSALLSGLTTYYFHQAFTLGRRTKRLLAAMAVPAVVNIALNALLIPHFGVAGAAWATLISFGVGLCGSIVLGRSAMPLPMPWEALIRSGVATTAMVLVVLQLPPIGGFAELVLDASVGGLVYAAVALTLNAAGVRDVALRLIAARRARSALA